jgi:hypothetical protein
LEHPNSDRIHLSFKRGIERYGLPESIYIDNGKDYRTLDFAGGRKGKKATPDVDKEQSRVVCDLLDVDVTFAKPYNSRAKTVERKFQTFIEKLERFSRGYAGPDAERRPEITERRRKASVRHPGAAEEMDFLCTLDEFRERVDAWSRRINEEPAGGEILDGHSPVEMLRAERSTPHYIEDRHLSILCLRSSGERQIHRCQWYDRELDVYYHAEWMYDSRIQGTKAFAKRDPQDPEEAWIFDAEDGSLIGRAERKKRVHPLAETQGTEEEKEELEKQLAMQQEYLAGLEEKKEEIQQSQWTEEEMDRYYEAWAEDHVEETEDDIEGPQDHEKKEHPVAADWEAQVEAQEQAGRDDLPYDPDKAASEETGTDDDTDDSLDADDLKIWPDE